MSKKYLLYIHHPNFQLEKKKSELVNKLLDAHYDSKLTPAQTPKPAEPVLVARPNTGFKPETEETVDEFLERYSDPSQKKPPHPVYGYPCCHNEAKCKHWQYNQNIAQWVNQLTGITEDAPDF